MLFKLILAEVIEDEPEWVQDDMESIENRVKQTEDSVNDKKLMERLAQHYEPIELLYDVLDNLHKDRQLSALLVPKLKQGCLDFIKDKKNFEAT